MNDHTDQPSLAPLADTASIARDMVNEALQTLGQPDRYPSATRDAVTLLRGAAALLAETGDDLASAGEAGNADPEEPPTIQAMLTAGGVHSFTEKELARASREWPPPRKYWEGLLAVAQVAQSIRDAIGMPLNVRSCYRPDDHDSQHRFASALDLDLTPPHRADKENVMALRMASLALWVDQRQTEDYKLAGIGFYRRPQFRVHIDVHTPIRGSAGRRYWYQDEVRPVLRALDAQRSKPSE